MTLEKWRSRPIENGSGMWESNVETYRSQKQVESGRRRMRSRMRAMANALRIYNCKTNTVQDVKAINTEEGVSVDGIHGTCTYIHTYVHLDTRFEIRVKFMTSY